MKTKFLLCLLWNVFSVSFAFAQQDGLDILKRSAVDSLYYYYNGEKIFLPLNTQHFTVYVSVKKLNDDRMRREYGVIKSFYVSDSVNCYEIRVDNTNYDSVFQRLCEDDFLFVGQVVDYCGNTVSVSNKLSVQLSDIEDTILLQRIPFLKISNVYTDRNFLYNWVDLEVKKNSRYTTINLGNMLYEKGIATKISYGFLPVGGAE